MEFSMPPKIGWNPLSNVPSDVTSHTSGKGKGATTSGGSPLAPGAPPTIVKGALAELAPADGIDRFSWVPAAVLGKHLLPLMTAPEAQRTAQASKGNEAVIETWKEEAMRKEALGLKLDEAVQAATAHRDGLEALSKVVSEQEDLKFQVIGITPESRSAKVKRLVGLGESRKAHARRLDTDASELRQKVAASEKRLKAAIGSLLVEDDPKARDSAATMLCEACLDPDLATGNKRIWAAIRQLEPEHGKRYQEILTDKKTETHVARGVFARTLIEDMVGPLATKYGLNGNEPVAQRVPALAERFEQIHLLCLTKSRYLCDNP